MKQDPSLQLTLVAKNASERNANQLNYIIDKEYAGSSLSKRK